MDRQQDCRKVGKQEVKDQQIEKAMDGIENRIRHIYNCGYQQGYEDGKSSYGTEIRTKQDVDEAYQRGYDDGKKNHEKVRNDDMGYGYRRGLEDAWECARKLRHPRYGGYYDHEQLDIFGYENSDDVLTNFTADQAMKKIMDYEYKKKQKGFEKCSECKYKDADLCKTEPLHEEDEDGNCIDFVPEDSKSTQPPRRKWAIVKPDWIQVPKCRDCKYFESTLMPCNRCRDNSEYVPKNEEDVRKESHE